MVGILRVILGFIFALAAAVLILVNSIAVLSLGFWGSPMNWSLIFWWLGGPSGLGQPMATLIGLIAGFMVMTGAIMMILRSGAFGAAIALPFAIISIIIGGGFMIGVALGIISGIFGVIGR